MNSVNTNFTTDPTTYDALFALLRSCLWGEERFPFIYKEETLNWDEICKEMSWHAIRILPTDLLCKLDPQNQQRYLMHASFNLSSWYAIMEAQNELCGLFAKAGIPLVILKGIASARYYPQPTYRQMGDIDFLVLPKDFDRAYALMLENGYKQLDGDTHRHIEFKKNSFLFELHRVFATFKEPERAKLLDDMLFDAFDRLETATVEVSFETTLFPPLESGLILIEHINQHLEDGLGLRQILDWALYVDKELDDETWVKDFAPIMRKLELETLAVAVTRMCQMYLGLREGITWCADADEDVCHQLMSYIMEQGNFGRKDSNESNRAIKVFSVMQNVPAFFRRLHKNGMNRMPLIHKYPWLKPLLTPFAWILQLCRYIHLGLKREHPFKNLISDIKKTQHKDALMGKLGVNQQKKGVKTSND